MFSNRLEMLARMVNKETK